MIKVSVDDLKYRSDFCTNYGQYQEGYRIVYFYPNSTYHVGTFSGSIEGFMMDFVEVEPIENDDDIPQFISIEDLLNRYLSDVKEISAVAIYKTDGTLIERLDRNNLNKQYIK